MIKGIDHIQLAMPAGEEATARTFFGETLGLVEIPKPDSLKGRGGVWFTCGAQELHVGVEAGFLPAKKAHPAFLVADLARLEGHLRENGVAITHQSPLPGAIRFFVEDPFGNRIELIERVAS